MPQSAPSCTVADLLATSHLKLSLATPGADLARPVRWVQTTELVDPTPYLRPDELVCTVGTSLTSQRAIKQFTAAVSTLASALCFGLGDVHEKLPEGLVTACQQAKLPLLTLPYGVPFLAVAEVVEQRRGLASQARTLGNLIDLIRTGMARPDSLASTLEAASLRPTNLLVAAWPAGSAQLLASHLDPTTLAETADCALSITDSLDSVLAAAAQTHLPCGYAHPSGLAEIAVASATARSALAASHSTSEPCGPDDVASFDLMIEAVPASALQPFLTRVIEPLVRAGEAASPTYLETLEAYLDHGMSVGQAAKAQFLHPNTVRHRLGLIKELTGKDPFVADDLLALAVALKAYGRYRRHRPHR